MMFNKNKKKFAKDVNYLDLIPKRNVGFKTNDIGIVTLEGQRFYNKFAIKYIVPRLKNPYINIKLDDFGSATWDFIDGNSDVRIIGEKLVQKFGETVQPVYERLTKFLTQLYFLEYIKFKE